MHRNNLRGMPNRLAGVPAPETTTFGGENGLITDQQHLNVTFLGSLERPFNGRGRSMVTAHCIKRNTHSGLSASRMMTCRVVTKDEQPSPHDMRQEFRAVTGSTQTGNGTRPVMIHWAMRPAGEAQRLNHEPN